MCLLLIRKKGDTIDQITLIRWNWTRSMGTGFSSVIDKMNEMKMFASNEDLCLLLREAIFLRRKFILSEDLSNEVFLNSLRGNIRRKRLCPSTRPIMTNSPRTISIGSTFQQEEIIISRTLPEKNVIKIQLYHFKSQNQTRAIFKHGK